MTLRPANYKYRRTNGTSLTGEKVYAEIELTNEDDLALNRHGYLPEHEIRRVTCRALVDSSVWDLVISEDVHQRLNLPLLDRRTAALAETLDMDIVGPVQVRFEDHFATVRAIVSPGTSVVLLGRFPLNGLDAFIDPKGKRLLVNPDDIKKLKRVA